MPRVVHAGWEARPPQVDTSQHLGLVRKIASQFRDAPLMDFDERVSLGMQGLEKAARIYDPARGTKFSTMAVPWIWQAIKYAYDREGYGDQRTFAPGRRALRLSLWDASPEGDILEPPAPAEPDAVEQGEYHALLWRHVAALGPRQAYVVLRIAQGVGTVQVGSELGCSAQRVSQLHIQALARLRVRFARLGYSAQS